MDWQFLRHRDSCENLLPPDQWVSPQCNHQCQNSDQQHHTSHGRISSIFNLLRCCEARLHLFQHLRKIGLRTLLFPSSIKTLYWTPWSMTKVPVVKQAHAEARNKIDEWSFFCTSLYQLVPAICIYLGLQVSVASNTSHRR